MQIRIFSEQDRLDGFGFFQPESSAFAVGRFPVLGIRHCRQPYALREDVRFGSRADLLRQLLQRLRAEFLFAQVFYDQQVFVINPGDPEVIDDLFDEGIHVLDDFAVEWNPALKGVLAEDPLVETVDGMDRGQVIGLERQVDGRERFFRIDPFEKGFEERVGAFTVFENLQGLAQLGADAITQLGGRGLCKGRHQDVFNLEVLFDQEADKELGDRIGLSGSRARLDELDTVKRDGCRIECAGHSPSPR